MRVLIVIALSALLVSCGGQIRSATTVPTATAAAAMGADTVKAAIEAANTAQAKAFATGDASLMRATATTAYFAELMQTNRQLAGAGVRSFELVRIDWVDVTVDGATAHATTDETWRTTFFDGSIDERTDRNEYTLVQESGAWKIQSDLQPAAHQIDPAAPAPRVVPTQVASTSSNWSGYVATGGTFTSVTGTWTVPSVSPSAPGADATWVGIGGMGSSDLIQAGTQAAVGGGSVEYTAWTETLPQASHTVPLAVRAGDSVTVTLTERPGAQWAIAIVNNTTRETYKTTVPYTSSHASAEWIEEAPSAGRGIVPLDNFGAVRFTQSTAVRDGTAQTLSALGARSVAMINGARQAVAQPSALDANGIGFTVTRTAASATAGSRPPRRRG